MCLLHDLVSLLLQDVAFVRLQTDSSLESVWPEQEKLWQRAEETFFVASKSAFRDLCSHEVDIKFVVRGGAVKVFVSECVSQSPTSTNCLVSLFPIFPFSFLVANPIRPFTCVSCPSVYLPVPRSLVFPRCVRVLMLVVTWGITYGCGMRVDQNKKIPLFASACLCVWCFCVLLLCLCSGRPATGPDVESSPSVSFPLSFSFFSL